MNDQRLTEYQSEGKREFSIEKALIFGKLQANKNRFHGHRNGLWPFIKQIGI